MAWTQKQILKYRKDEYKRYVGGFKVSKLADESFKLLSFDDWMAAPKRRDSIMPANLPEHSKIQKIAFKNYIDSLKKKNLLRAIVHYDNGEVWLYLNSCAYTGPIRGMIERTQEFDKMCAVHAHNLIRGHSDRGFDLGRRIGKKSNVEWLEKGH